MDAGTTGILILLLLIFVLCYLVLEINRKRAQLPAGPAPWPILGNLWQTDVFPLCKHYPKVRGLLKGCLKFLLLGETRNVLSLEQKGNRIRLSVSKCTWAPCIKMPLESRPDLVSPKHTLPRVVRELFWAAEEIVRQVSFSWWFGPPLFRISLWIYAMNIPDWYVKVALFQQLRHFNLVIWSVQMHRGHLSTYFCAKPLTPVRK